MRNKLIFSFFGEYAAKNKNIFLIFILGTFLSGCTDYTQIHGRYVDYNCEPISGEKFTLHGSTISRSTIVPYAYSTPYDNTVTTDNNGYFSGYAKGRHSSIEIFPYGNQRSNTNRRNFNKVELDEILVNISKNNPLVFYKEPDNIKIRFRKHDQSMITLHDGIRSVRWIKLPYLAGNYGWHYDDLWFRWGYLPMNGHSRPIFELSTVRGGLYEVERGELPFKSKFPETGYKGAVRLDLETTPNGHIKRAYYMKTRGDTTYGTLILDIVKRAENQYSVNMVFDTISNKDKGNRFTERLVLSVHEGSGVERSRTPINKLVNINMPPVTCGGILNYDYDGYYVNYPYDSELKKEQDRRLLFRKQDYVKNKIIVSDKPLSLDGVNMDDRLVISAMLDKFDANQETIRAIYQHYKNKEVGEYRVIFDAFAYLENTSDDILIELIAISRGRDLTSYAGIIASRQNLSAQVIEAILSKKWDYRAKEILVNNPETKDEAISRLVSSGHFPSLATGNLSNITASTLEKITEALVSPKNRADEKVLAIIAWAKKANAETLSSIFSYNEQQRSPKYEIRHNLAHNPSTPAKILDKLSQFNDIHVRTGVYCNSNTSIEVLVALKDKDLLQCTPYGIHQLLAIR